VTAQDAPERESDRIEIRGLRVLGTHGVLAEEQQRAQPFELDIDLWLDLARAGDTDDLMDTVDYSVVLDDARDLVATRSFQLLEALADAVADRVLAGDPRIEAARVSVRKLRPPVPADVTSVGVRVLRRRRDGPAPSALTNP
jgi:dihydroneopterin aldolase